MNPVVFISHASRDRPAAEAICGHLEGNAVSCWMTPRDLCPGTPCDDQMAAAIDGCYAIVAVMSPHANSSPHVVSELCRGTARGKRVLPVLVAETELSGAMASLFSAPAWIKAFPQPVEQHLAGLVETVRRLLRKGDAGVRNGTDSPARSRGYVFVSYVAQDRNYMQRMTPFLRGRGYAYWDYQAGDREYGNTLHHELEDRIREAAAFLCIVSDRWRQSDWVAKECIFAKDVGVPIFVAQVEPLTQPCPILLNDQTRIDMSADFERGLVTLDDEFAKAGL